MKQLLLAPSIKGGDFPGGTSGKKKKNKQTCFPIQEV